MSRSPTLQPRTRTPCRRTAVDAAPASRRISSGSDTSASSIQGEAGLDAAVAAARQRETPQRRARGRARSALPLREVRSRLPAGVDGHEHDAGELEERADDEESDRCSQHRSRSIPQAPLAAAGAVGRSRGAWCRRWDSNPHGRDAQRFLRPSRLPFRHFGAGGASLAWARLRGQGYGSRDGEEAPHRRGLFVRVHGAEDEGRTRDLLLGKEALYH